MRKRFIIVTPDSVHGSFGDQAMMASAIVNLRRKYDSAEIILFNVYNCPEDTTITKSYGLDVINYYPKTDVVTEFINLAMGCDALYVIGADIMDGAYSEEASMIRYKLIDAAHALGLKTSILGFSFNKTANKKICKTIKRISKYTVLNVRDLDSFARLRKIGCKNMRQVADAAFLLDERSYKKSEYAENLYSEILNIKKTQKVIGVNLTHSRQEDCKAFITKISDALQQFKNICVIIFPHDLRTYDNHVYFDYELCGFLETALRARGIDCINAINLGNEADVKHVLGLMDFVLTCRMHLAIASLSKGVVPISFVYNDKFEGLYKLYNFDKCLTLQRSCGVDDIVNSIKYVMSHDLESCIDKKKSDVLRMSNKNFYKPMKFDLFLSRRKNHINKYEMIAPTKGPYFTFVSLGWDCFSRTMPTWWNMKHTKAEGELSMPFDLAMHNIRSIIKILDNDFADFFDSIRFDAQTGNWYNDKYYSVYNHDQSCTTVDEFTSRYINRINNFRNVVQNSNHVFFVYHDFADSDTEKRHIKKLSKILSRLRGNKKFRLIVISAKPMRNNIKNTSVIYVKEPYIDYVWWNGERNTVLGNEYEVKVVKSISKICRKYTFLWNLADKLRDRINLFKKV